MREISQLISDVRFATGETDENRFPDERLLKFFNDAQDQIEALILIANFENSPLDKRYKFSTISGQEAYSLPSDIYAYNSVSDLRIVDGARVAKISFHSRERGYFILGNKINFNPIPDSAESIAMIYKAKLPRIEDVGDAPNLPAMCDGFMTTFVERRVHSINSSTDVQNSNVFTEEERNIITEIFSNNNSDTTEIPDKRGQYVDFEY